MGELPSTTYRNLCSPQLPGSDDSFALIVCMAVGNTGGSLELRRILVAPCLGLL